MSAELDSLRVGVRLDEGQILLLLGLLAPAGGGHCANPERARLQADLSAWLGVLRRNKESVRLERAGAKP